MSKENFLSESSIRDKPKKRLNLVLRERSVTTDKIADAAIDTSKIKERSVTADKLSEGIIDELYNVMYGKIPIIPDEEIDTLMGESKKEEK